MMPPATCGKLPTTPAEFPGRVLVVDDEALVCWSIAAGLRQVGLVTDTAATAADALVLARVKPHPDAVLLDARLLEGNVSDLFRELRAIAPSCRFLVMTTEQHALRAVADDALIVRKPFDLADVVRQVGAEIRLARRLMDVPTAQVPRDHHSNRTHQKSCTDIAK